jgi:hypothetical protein
VVISLTPLSALKPSTPSVKVATAIGKLGLLISIICTPLSFLAATKA